MFDKIDMKCIFCGNDSSNSKSIEHIIPESFGNSTTVLPQGVVCDKCNNYIGRKIEAPFLNSEAILMLRQELALKTKSDKTIQRFDYPKTKEIVQHISPNFYFVFSQNDKTEDEIQCSVEEYMEYVNKTDEALLTPSIFLSRLLAKMAVEAFVHRCGVDSGVCDYVREDDAFKALRMHVRYEGRKIWEYSARRIYSRTAAYQGNSQSSVSWEYDFLFLANGEVYFVIAMFGIEYAINMGGSSIEGYKEWLKNNKNISPLYISDKQREENYMGYVKKMFSSNSL